GVLSEPVLLSVTRVIDLLDVVFAIGKEAAEEQIRVRVIGVHGAGGVGPEIISTCNVVCGIDADVARHSFKVKADLHVVSAFDPSEVAADGLQLVGAVKRPAAVEAIAGGARNALARGLGAEAGRKTETDVGPEVEIVGGKNPRQRDRITIGILEREETVLVQSHVGRMVRLVAAIDAPTGLADQIGVEGVNQGCNDARRWNVIAMMELPPAISGRAENLAVAVVASVFLQQPDVGRGLGVDGIVHAKDLVRARPGE